MDKQKLLIRGSAFIASFVVVLGGLLYLVREEPASPGADALLTYDVTGKSPGDIARWIYDNHNCSTCHTLTTSGVFGLTARGQQLARDFEGCPGMLQTVWQTLTIPEAQWTAKQKQVRSNFNSFGCAVCHQVGPTAVGLTEVGARAAALHMSCPGVMRAVNR